MEDAFWLSDPKILFKKDKIFEIWPYENMSYNQKLNATTRFLIIISCLGYMILNNYLILLFGLVLTLLIILIHNIYNKENYDNMNGIGGKLPSSDYEKHTSKNPLYNVMLTDYEDNPQKEKTSSIYNEEKEELINNQAKNFVLENNKENKDIGKVFDNLANNIEFEKSMRQFHINPSTTIPNDQKDFLNYCYGDLYSEKPLNVY